MNIKSGKNENRFKKKVKPKDFKKTFRRIIEYFKDDKKIIIIILILIVLDSILVTIVPYLIGKIVDVVGNTNIITSVFYNILIALFISYSIDFVVNLSKGMLTTNLSQKIVKRMRRNLFKKMEMLPLDFFYKNQVGDLMSRFINDIESISSGISSSMVQLITDLLNICLTLVIMLKLSITLTILTIILVPMVTILSKFIANRTRKLFKNQQIELGKLNAQVEEIISQINIVKAFNYENKAVEDFKNINKELYKVSLKAQIYTGLLMPLINVISNIGFTFICIVGGILATKNIITIGVIASFLSYSKQFTRPLNEIANLFNTFQSALAGCERVFEILDEKEELDKGNLKIDNNTMGEIELKNVTFSYDNKQDILKDICMHLKIGTSNAIVGETGSGKTTIINLITNFYEISNGQIILNGKDINEYSKENLRNYIGVVPQETYLFDGSINENLKYGKLDASEDEIINACKIGNSNKFIMKLNEKYNTFISEEGDGLSEGQKQLISISRTILKNPKILILDEATSSIDITTERKIQEAIKSIMKGRTSIIIAHRLSTIYNCDNIMVLENGRVVESGNHEELMKLKGRYYKNILLSRAGGS